uniref:Uncharacterized protein n=1 Tax=Arundo donax TaxID=35708 RepID=A0A0A9G964_ARUDO
MYTPIKYTTSSLSYIHPNFYPPLRCLSSVHPKLCAQKSILLIIKRPDVFNEQLHQILWPRTSGASHPSWARNEFPSSPHLPPTGQPHPHHCPYAARPTTCSLSPNPSDAGGALGRRGGTILSEAAASWSDPEGRVPRWSVRRRKGGT